MPGAAERAAPGLLVDTSVAVPALLEDHEAHAAMTELVRERAPGLAGHAAVETYSVLTRLPEPLRVRPFDAARLIAARFPSRPHPTAAHLESLLAELAAAGVAGGATYDALVAAAAVDAGLPLASRDHRALRTYTAVGAQVELIE